MALFEDHELEIPCPGCGHKTKQTIAWVKTHTEYVCSGVGCGQTVTLNRDELLRGLKVVQKSLDDIRRQIRNLKL